MFCVCLWHVGPSGWLSKTYCIFKYNISLCILNMTFCTGAWKMNGGLAIIPEMIFRILQDHWNFVLLKPWFLKSSNVVFSSCQVKVEIYLTCSRISFFKSLPLFHFCYPQAIMLCDGWKKETVCGHVLHQPYIAPPALGKDSIMAIGGIPFLYVELYNERIL